ncbi:MAG: insulinase family protein [Bacteroidetes bacterium]|nr:insulinase family protein [Bacteroidota bacterium]
MKKNLSVLRTVILLFSLLCFHALGFAQFNLKDKLPIDPNVKIGKLANGLHYYIQKNSKPEKKVELRLVVNAGSVLEDPDQLGLAHMMEHMNFNGSKHFARNELVSYLQSIGVQFGADLNAYTSFDETVYILPIPSDDQEKIDKGFTILEDWAGNALLSDSAINRERGIVLEESRLGKGANERMRKIYFPKLLNGSKYAERLPIGKDNIIENFKPEVLRKFYKTWYRPDLEAVVVVGDIDPAVAEQEIIKHFSHFKDPIPERARPTIIPIPSRTVSESMVLTDKEQSYNVLQIYNYIEKDKPTTTWADYRADLVEGLFSAMINQRLSELTESANPPFVFGNSGFTSFLRGYRAFNSFALIGEKPVKDAVDALITTNESVKKYGFLSTELERAKSNLLNQTQTVFENRNKTESRRLVQEYVNNYLMNTPIPGIANRYEFAKQVLPTITLAEVNALAAKMESKQGKFVLEMAPEKLASQLPSNTQLMAMVNDASKLPVKPYQEKQLAKSLMEKRPTPGKITNETSNAILGTTDLTLSNGITITLKPTEFKNDQIIMDSWRWGGFQNYSLADKMNAENAANIVMNMGVDEMSAIDLQKFLAGKTVSVQPYINPNDEGMQGSSSVKDFETFLQLTHLYFTKPRKDETLFQSFVSSQKGFLKNLLNNPRMFFQDTVTKIEFQNNPWAGVLAKPEDYDKINLDRVLSIYHEIFDNPYGWHFTFVGNIDIAKVKPLLELYLGSLATSPKENKFTDVGMRPVKGIVNVDIKKGEEKQSLVNVVFTGELPYSDEEKLKLKALTDLLTIKIIEQLRENMSGIYGGGMRGSLVNRPYNHYAVNLTFPCGPENVQKLTNAAFDIIKHIQDNGPEQKDLDKVKETLKKKNEEELMDNGHWLESLSSSWIDKTDPQWILNYSKQIDALSLSDIQQAAKKYLNMQNYFKAVLYPEK